MIAPQDDVQQILADRNVGLQGNILSSYSDNVNGNNEFSHPGTLTVEANPIVLENSASIQSNNPDVRQVLAVGIKCAQVDASMSAVRGSVDVVLPALVVGNWPLPRVQRYTTRQLKSQFSILNSHK